MVTIDRDPTGNDGFCRYCGKTGLPPQATVCSDESCEPSDHTYRECGASECRNILGPVSPESNDKYCSNKCASKSI